MKSNELKKSEDVFIVVVYGLSVNAFMAFVARAFVLFFSFCFDFSHSDELRPSNAGGF